MPNISDCMEEYGALMASTDRVSAAIDAKNECQRKYEDAVNQYKNQMLATGIGMLVTAVLAAPETGGASLLLGVLTSRSLLAALTAAGLNVYQFQPVADAAKAKIAAEAECDAAEEAHFEISTAYSNCLDKHK